MSSFGITPQTFSQALQALPGASSDSLARMNQANLQAAEAIQSVTGMPPLGEFFSAQASQLEMQGQVAGRTGSTAPDFIQQLSQEISALQVPSLTANSPGHISVFA